MSEINVDKIADSTGLGAPEFPYGVILNSSVGVITAANVSVANSVTATEYYGDGSKLTGIAAGDASYAAVAGIATDAEGLTGFPSIDVTNVNASGEIDANIVDVTTRADVGSITSPAGGVQINTGDIQLRTDSRSAESPGVMLYRGGNSQSDRVGGFRADGYLIAASGGEITGDLSIDGNVSVAGTITHQDVTDVDSVGLITARSGINVTGGSVEVGSGVTITSGGVNVVGIVTATSIVIDKDHELSNQKLSGQGSNLILNGDWATGDSTNWTTGDGNYTEQFNQGGFAYIVTRTGGTSTNADYQTFATTSGASYNVTFDVTMAGGAKVFSGSGLSGSVLGQSSSSDESGIPISSGFSFTADASTATICVQIPEDGGTYMYDNVVVREQLTIPHLNLKNSSSGDLYAKFVKDGSSSLYYNNSSKFETTNTGAVVTGILTATSFSGDGSALTGVVGGASWTLGANGTSDYTFTGPGLTGAENDPAIYVVRGQTYNFVNNMGAHPFRIQTTPNGSAGTAYNDGITNNDVSNGTLEWDVQFDAPDVLYYQCTAHPDMGGIIYIGTESRGLENITNSGRTLVKGDVGTLINTSSGGTVTVQSGVFEPGDLITVYNNYSSTMSISPSGTTLRKAGTSNTGTCTVDQYGTASILCVASNEFVVSGNIS